MEIIVQVSYSVLVFVLQLVTFPRLENELVDACLHARQEGVQVPALLKARLLFLSLGLRHLLLHA